MIISILTLFPEMFTGPFDFSIIKRAKDKRIVDIRYVNIRDFSKDAYKTVDEHPYGGGQGMILRADIISDALSFVKKSFPNKKTRIVLTTPQGTHFTQKIAHTLSETEHLILLCGHYEGIDERIRSIVDEEISIGDYIVTGGEIPAMVMVDAIVRLLPGVFKKDNVTSDESFEAGMLEHPQYTKPPNVSGMNVPAILLSGNHKKISEWQKKEALKRTRERRPDLLKKIILRRKRIR